MGAVKFSSISTEDLGHSIAFYRDVIGFEVADQGVSNDLRPFLGLEGGRGVEWAMMRACNLPVGQILLLQCHGISPVHIREPGDKTTRGLWNLNFYVVDLKQTAANLQRDGFALWSDPVEYSLGAAGRAIEVLFDAPDGVAINLVQPMGDAGTFTRRIADCAERFGHTTTGFSPVATTACCVRSAQASGQVFQDAMGLRVVLDEVLGQPETNRFLGRPADAKSRTMFFEGEHFFGKVSLNVPLNYDVPERSDRLFPANIGYFALGFSSEDPDQDAACAETAGMTVVSRVGINDMPAIGGGARLLRSADGYYLWLFEEPSDG